MYKNVDLSGLEWSSAATRKQSANSKLKTTEVRICQGVSVICSIHSSSSEHLHAGQEHCNLRQARKLFQESTSPES